MDHIDESLSQNLICHIAELIDEISGYRTGAEHIPSAPSQVQYLLYNVGKTNYNSAYEKAAYFHIQFERIHPFSDGNGRTGRILINFLLLKDNKAPVIIEKDIRAKYFELIANQDYMGLAQLLQELSEKELERIKQIMRR